jgi:2-polyprenyl-3-methyl-5-hydroxy-6-metoxy-1,4-benzoquinol methylase
MAFDLKHWSNPRNTIANIYKDNDMAYVTHGVMCAYEILLLINEKPLDLKNKTILDYGCGTGKNTRAIHYFFKKAVGYDPVKECINEAHKEFNNINKPILGLPDKIDLLRKNVLYFTDDISTIIGTEFDYVFANNVIEHLTGEEQITAIDNMLKMCKRGGKVIFNTFIEKSKNVIESYKAKKEIIITSNFGYYIIIK